MDLIVFVLGAHGGKLRREAWCHARQVLHHFSRLTPLLATVVAGRDQDADVVLSELQHDKWWQASVAIQSHASEVLSSMVIRHLGLASYVQH